MKKVAIISSGYLPVPAVMGGAVEALTENVIRQNERAGKMDLTIFSSYHKEAENEADSYQSSTVLFVKIPVLFRGLDAVCYHLAKDILKKENAISYKCIFQRFYYIYKVARELKKGDFDRVVLENHPSLFLTLKLFGNHRKYEGRYYYHLHNEVTKAHNCRQIMANCKKMIGVSDYINRTFQAFLGEDDKNEYVVLRNKIDRERFAGELSPQQKCQLRKQYHIEEQDTIVLFTGRFSPEKGVRELLEAFSRISDEHVKLLVVGGHFFGSGVSSLFEVEMKDLAESIKDRVQFTGFVEYDRIPEFYALADLVVIPSVWDDPAPLTVIESLTAGKALITTCSGGIPEYADPKNSILLERGEDLVSNLANAICELSRSPKRRREMEMAAAKQTQDWTLEQFYEDFCELLEV